MENLGMNAFGGVYAGLRVLVTGHTGFKGSWLALWLSELGARVTGVALAPETTPNHWDLLQIKLNDHRLDIRDVAALEKVVAEARPHIIFHLAAQALVRRSYRDPLQNWSTNVMGTAHVLEAARKVKDLFAVVVATTDKVYANQEWERGYREEDRLGGHDPYSASKAACELVVESYRKSFFATQHPALLATVRAGNVIGGGDWSEDRLIPDLVRAIDANKPLEIRSPHSTRPWQHVLECLNGYLLLGQKLLERQEAFAEAWNFGPEPEDNRTVAEILARLKNHWPELIWHMGSAPVHHEAKLLYLDHSKARGQLGWRPVWNLETALTATVDWYRNYMNNGVVQSRRQLMAYIEATGALKPGRAEA